MTERIAPGVTAVEGLTGSQGSLALASALFAGFALEGLLQMGAGDFEKHSSYVMFGYVLVTILAITLNMFVCGVCTLLEQQGRIAAALAHTKQDARAYEKQLRGWYEQPAFAAVRSKIFWVYALGVPCCALSIALYCLIKLPGLAGKLSCALILVFGAVLWRTYKYINDLFRVGVLGLSARESKRRNSMFEVEAPKIVLSPQTQRRRLY